MSRPRSMYPRKRFNRRSLVATLLVISLLAVLMPRSITGRLIGLVQVLTPFQHWLTKTADEAGNALAADGESSAETESLRRTVDALRHQVLSLGVRLNESRKAYDEVIGIRERGLNNGRLVPAAIVSTDLLAFRESGLVNAGTLAGVRAGAPVASDYFTIHLEDEGMARQGLAVLAGEVLVGFVESAGTYTARVQLITDPETRMPVSIARLEENRLLPLNADFWMEGGGGNRLIVRDVDHRYIKSGSIQVGDVVLSDPSDSRLPASMTIGVIKEITQNKDNVLLYTLAVEPPVHPSKVRRVYIVDPAEERS